MLPNYDSSQHPATPLAPQPQRPMSHQPPEQLRVGQGAGVTTDALELRLAALFRFGCPPCTSLGHWQTHHIGEPSHFRADWGQPVNPLLRSSV